MPCHSPLVAYRSLVSDANGKHNISFKKMEKKAYTQISIACGQCLGCRLNRSREWALRCVHEAKLWPKNSFITLTYNDNNLPWNKSLNKKHFQDFMKRLRKHNPRSEGDRIRYYHCGEYGDKTQRPHYHAIMFNYDPEDKVHWKTNRRTGEKYYISEKLNKIWGKGYCVIGEVTFESAAYVARYVLKKMNGKKKNGYTDPDTGKYHPPHYERLLEKSLVTGKFEGEVVNVIPEYTTMSRNGGIGKEFYEKYKSDIYPSDYCIIKGKKQKPPRYYDRLLEIEDSPLFNEIKEKRAKNANSQKFKNNYSPDRLAAQAIIDKQKVELLIRPEI